MARRRHGAINTVGTSSTNPDRVAPGGGTGGGHMRSRSTILRLKLYKSGGKAIRSRDGRIVKPAPLQSRLPSGTVARIEPDRRWFGNTRVIDTAQLQAFRDGMAQAQRDPYALVLRQNKLPMSLLTEPKSGARPHLVDTEPFESTFGPRAQRKRPRLRAGDLAVLVADASGAAEAYDPERDGNRERPDDGVRAACPDPVFTKGQSHRIWGELYKVIDSSDVILQVLDARDPAGTRTRHVEEYIRREKSHKQLVFVLNKVDLVPTTVTRRWVRTLSAEAPTLAFHASITNPFGKGALIQLLRQFAALHADKKQISVGIIGYPNVGKSSIINTLAGRRVCSVAPIPGQTKVWQYVTLMRRIYLIDCPGVVYANEDTDSDRVLKGVVRVENIGDPTSHVPAVLSRAKPQHLASLYGVRSWTSADDFLEQLAARSGKLLPGGEPDVTTVAKMLLNDWQRGRIPYFTEPPDDGASHTEQPAAATATDATHATPADDAAALRTGLPHGEPAQRPLPSAANSARATAEVDGEADEKQQLGKKKRIEGEEEANDDGDDDEKARKAPPKEPRMTTNKRKTGVHFYAQVDVKNRRRR